MSAAELREQISREVRDRADRRAAAYTGGVRAAIDGDRDEDPDPADYKRQFRHSHGGGRNTPWPRTSPGDSLQLLALGDPAEIVRDVKRRWPDLLARITALAAAEGQRPYAMLFDVIERGIEASEDCGEEEARPEPVGPQTTGQRPEPGGGCSESSAGRSISARRPALAPPHRCAAGGEA